MICSVIPSESPAPSIYSATVEQVCVNPVQSAFLASFLEAGRKMFIEYRIYQQLQKKFGTKNRQESWELFGQMILFLWLTQITPFGYRFVPPDILDAVWHEFILFSEAYHEFCSITVGGYIHHTPITTANCDRFKALERWLPTLAELESFIGEGLSFNPEYWEVTKDECAV